MSANITGLDLASTPALLAPSGVTPDLVHATVEEKTGFIVSAAVSLGVASIFVVLRLYTKARVLKEFLLEDYAIVAAWLGIGAWYGLNFAASANGKHQWDVSLEDLQTYLKYINSILILYCPIAFLAKLSILVQLRQIFTRQRNAVYWLCQVSIYINLAFYITLIFLSIFQCVPRQRIWTPWLQPGGTCIPLAALLIPPAAAVALSDIWILTLPVIVMWRLHIPFARKIAISASFSIGLVSLVAAVMPLYHSARFLRTADETFAVYPIALWAGVQLCTLVLAAASPTLPRLWAHVRGEGATPASFEKNSALNRIASFRRRRLRRDTLDFCSPTPEIGDLAALGRPETPYEIFKTTEVRVTSYRLDQPNAAIGQAL